MKDLHVHVKRTFSKEVERQFRSALDERVILTVGEEIPSKREVHILVAGRPEREILASMDQLERVIIPWAGVSRTTRELLLDFPHLQLHNLHHNAVPTAETALALMFAISKSIVPLDQALRKGDWRPRYDGGHSLLLDGKQALILGFGEIGRALGQRLRGLGVGVNAIRRQIQDSDQDEISLYPPHALHDLLPAADVLFITVPLTEETEGMIGQEEIDLLPETAVLINISRGPVVEEEALYSALQEGGLFGAGLDVWYSYPRQEEERDSTQPADFPFHDLENVVLSPHRGGSTLATEVLRIRHLARLINAAARDEDVPNRVSLQAGY